MADVAIELGYDSSRIELEDLSLDTDDQAQAMVGMLGDKPFVMVTSAYHMPRSMRLFERRGLSPIPAPTNRLVKKASKLHPGAFFPSAINLQSTRIAFREGLGIAWASLMETIGK